MNTGQIVKGRRKHDFAIIPNEISQSMQLNFEEKGMLCFLLSLPDNWVLYKKNLYDQVPDSKHAVDRVFKSLQDKGYVLSCRNIDVSSGKMMGWNHIVYDSPQLNEVVKKPTSSFPDVGENQESVKPPLYKERDSNKEKYNKYIFSDFWNSYDKKVDKKQTEAVWNKMSNDDQIKAVEGMNNHKLGRERKYWKDPIRYLRDRRWEDEPLEQKQTKTQEYDRENTW